MKKINPKVFFERIRFKFDFAIGFIFGSVKTGMYNPKFVEKITNSELEF